MSETKLAVIDGQTLTDTRRFEKRRCPAQKNLSLERASRAPVRHCRSAHFNGLSPNPYFYETEELNE